MKPPKKRSTKRKKRKAPTVAPPLVIKIDKSIKHPSDLVEEFCRSPRMQDADDALGNLIEMIVDACVNLNGIAAYGLSPVRIENALKRKGLGYPSLIQIRRAVELIAKPIEEENRRQFKNSPIRSAEDGVTEDWFYLHVFRPAYALFHGVRQPLKNVFTGIELTSGNAISPDEIRAIKALKPLPKDINAWARLIKQMTLSGNYWVNREAIEPGGKLYGCLAARALSFCEKRRDMKRDDFRTKHSIFPVDFLRLSDLERTEFVESFSAPDDLDRASVLATKLERRARLIEASTPTGKEVQSALLEKISDRLKTSPK